MERKTIFSHSAASNKFSLWCQQPGTSLNFQEGWEDRRKGSGPGAPPPPPPHAPFTPSLHLHYILVTAPSTPTLHPPYTFITPPFHFHDIIKTPSLHPLHTLIAPSSHPYYTLMTSSLHPHRSPIVRKGGQGWWAGSPGAMCRIPAAGGQGPRVVAAVPSGCWARSPWVEWHGPHC